MSEDALEPGHDAFVDLMKQMQDCVDPKLRDALIETINREMDNERLTTAEYLVTCTSVISVMTQMLVEQNTTTEDAANMADNLCTFLTASVAYHLANKEG